MLKAMLICYLIIFSASYLTSGTSAYFSSQFQVNNTITASTWVSEEPKVDESSLVFLGKGNQNIKICPAVIKVEIKNAGDGNMQADTTYEIYYTKNGNPEKHGEKIEFAEGEGIVEALVSGKTTELIYETSNPGRYIFLVYQNEGDLADDGIWSEEIKVDCKSKKADSVNIDKAIGKEVGDEEQIVDEVTEEKRHEDTATEEIVPESKEIENNNISGTEKATDLTNMENEENKAEEKSINEESANIESDTGTEDGEEN